jgi:hypothetical protein
MKHADVKKIPVFEDDQIDWNLTEAEVWEHYDFTFQQNFDVNAAGPEINGDELIFHDDPGLYSAVCFYLNSLTGEDRGLTNVSEFQSFLFLAEDFRLLSIIYGNFDRIYDAIAKDFDLSNVNAFYVLDILRDDIVGDAGRLLSHWTSEKGIPKEMIRHRGGIATAKAKENRINTLMDEIIKIKKPDKNGMISLKKNEWHKALMACNDGVMPSYPTVKKYKEKLKNIKIKG